MDTLEPIASLDDRLFDLLKERDFFTFEDARLAIPKEAASDITIYKAISRLVKQRRIRYVRTINRKKEYTTIGVSNLPVFRTVNGEDLLLKHLMALITTDKLYQGRHWRGSNALKDLPIILVKLFIIAQWEGSELRDGWVKTIQELQSMQAELTTMLSYIETVLKHPSMSGDMNQFKKVFGQEDPDMPSPEEINELKRWISKRNSK